MIKKKLAAAGSGRYIAEADFWEGKMGYINEKGEIVIDFKFNLTSDFSDGLALVQVLDGFWSSYGYINNTGKIIIPATFFEANDFNEGLAAVSDGGKYFGFIDKNGNQIVEQKLGITYRFSNGAAIVTESEYGKTGWIWKKGAIDKTGNFIIEPQYSCMTDFSEGFASVSKDEKWGIIDKRGNFLVKPKYSYVDNFKEGLARVEIDNKWGFINKSGEIVIKPLYEELKSFKEDLAAVKYGGKWGFINKTGEKVTDFIFEEVADFNEGLAAVLMNGGYSNFIDKTGKMVIKLKEGVSLAFSNKQKFSCGLTQILYKNKYGFIDKDSNIVMEPIYNYRIVGDFVEVEFDDETLTEKEERDKINIEIEKKVVLPIPHLSLTKEGKLAINPDMIYLKNAELNFSVDDECDTIEVPIQRENCPQCGVELYTYPYYCERCDWENEEYDTEIFDSVTAANYEIGVKEVYTKVGNILKWNTSPKVNNYVIYKAKISEQNKSLYRLSENIDLFINGNVNKSIIRYAEKDKNGDIFHSIAVLSKEKVTFTDKEINKDDDCIYLILGY